MSAPDTDKNQQHQRPCGDPSTGRPVDCQHIANERNHYFTGKLMTARDFRDESDYFLSHRRAHNRLLHGWGILCGLNVGRRPGKERCLDIHPGIALDCCGRELIVHKTMSLELPQEAAGEFGPEFLVCLQYGESYIEYLPALYAEGCAPGHREPNRIREGVQLVCKSPDDLKGCWKKAGGDQDAPICDDCNQPDSPTACLDPACACEDLVPLALLKWERKSEADPWQWVVYTDGRTVLPNPSVLTQIIWTNWTHGTSTNLSSLYLERTEEEKSNEDFSDYALVIKFNRKINASTGDGDGITPYTFGVWVTLGPEQPPYDPQDDDQRPVRLLDDGYTAIYRILADEIRGKVDIFGKHMVINLKCDFVVDCNDNPVDGDHLAGKLPTGNGVPGGQFESWTRIVDDRPPEVRQQQQRRRQVAR